MQLLSKYDYRYIYHLLILNIQWLKAGKCLKRKQESKICMDMIYFLFHRTGVGT